MRISGKSLWVGVAATLSVACGGTTRNGSGVDSGASSGGAPGDGGRPGSGGRVATGGTAAGGAPVALDAGPGAGGSCANGSDPATGCGSPCGARTDFPGDDACLAAPAGAGFQLHYGPSSYEDPDEVARYVILPGDESVDCVFRKTPNPQDAYADAFQARVRPGVVEFVAMSRPDAQPDSAGPETCRLGAGAYPMGFAMDQGTDFPLAGSPPAPELAGTALSIPARTQAALQVHAVNTTDRPLLKEAWINFTTVPASEVTEVASPIGFVGAVGASVPSHSLTVVGTDACMLPAGGPATLLGLTATPSGPRTRLTVFLQKAGDSNRQVLYENRDALEPLLVRYGSTWKNPAPDGAAGTSGGASGPITLEPGDSLSWECEFDNQSDRALSYADRLYGAVSCDLFGFLATDTSRPWACVSL